MKFFIRIIFIFLISAAAGAAEDSLRIGDASGGNSLNYLRRAWFSLSQDKRFNPGTFSFAALTPKQALEKLAAGEVEFIILETRDIPANFAGRRQMFAAEALVCYTGFGNPLASLSSKQLKEIWREEKPVWKKYNGEFNTIHRIGLTLDRGGFAEARFLGSPLRKEGVFRCKDVKRAWLFCNPSALLCAPYSAEMPGSVSPLPIDGIEPTEKNIVSGKYPLNLRYEILSCNKVTAVAEEFVKLITSPLYNVYARESGLLVISDDQGGKQP